MTNKILFVIDDIELKYFEFNDLVTDFWLIKKYLERGCSVSVAVKKGLFIRNCEGCTVSYGAELKNNNIFLSEETSKCRINDFDIVYFRPDPPVDTDYINACHIFDFVDLTKTFVINNPRSVIHFNEKFHINRFSEFIPKTIITSDSSLIKDFVAENNGEAIIKPLNSCFSQGIYYLNSKDKNLNSIIKSATNGEKTYVCVQEYLGNGQGGDKRAFILGEKVYEYSLRKLPGKDDFRFNTHSDEFFRKEMLTEKEMRAAQKIASELSKEGLYMAALDIIDEKITEINVTSPCYFFREMNRLHNIRFDEMIMNDLLKLSEKAVKL